MTFKVGDKVVVDVGIAFWSGGSLYKDKIYTVCDVDCNENGTNPRVKLAEIKHTGWWCAGRFMLSSPKPHKWAKEIIAWANGAEIEILHAKGVWVAVAEPSWSILCDYRIKPEKKPDRIETRFLAYDTKDEFVFPKDGVKPNVKFTFDGDTGKLKAVELIN